MMWKIQQAMQEDAIQVAIMYQGNRAEMFIAENFQLAYRDPGWKNRDLGNRVSPPCHTNTSKIHERFRGTARSLKPGNPGKPGSCEEGLSNGVSEKTNSPIDL